MAQEQIRHYSGGFGKSVATFVLGVALGGAAMYGLADKVEQAVHRVPAEQRYAIDYKAGTAFLEIVQNGKRLQLYQGREGPVFGPEYVVSSTQPADLEKIVKNGLGILQEEKQLEITVYGLKELEEGNRAEAIETGLDYCKPKTEADIVSRRLLKVMEDSYKSIKEKLKEFYGGVRDKITGGSGNKVPWPPHKLGGNENGNAQNSN